MFARFLTIAAASTLLAGVALADPVKPATPQSNTPTTHPTPVVLASADTVSTAPSQSQPSTAPKRRAMRVTNCRCGDPQTQAEDQQ